MPHFNNCRVGIFAKNKTKIEFQNAVIVKDALDTGLILKNTSNVVHMGLSGSTGSSFNIIASKRGIQLQNSSYANIENASIKNTQYGFVSTNASSFDFNKSVILGDSYVSFTGQAYGMFVTDGSVGDAFTTSITGYAGGTASLTSGNVSVVKNSILFVGTTADAQKVNTAALGASLAGNVYIDVNLGNKIIASDNVVSTVIEPEF
jgi:hypothetical protein